MITYVNFISTYKCPAGHWCEAKTTSATQNPCPPGTYNPNKGAKKREECIPAPPGFYIATAGASTLDSTHECTAGYYCKLGSYTPTPAGGTVTSHLTKQLLYTNIGGPCQSGYYCPTATPKMIPCTPGYLCHGTQVTVPSVKCPMGKYCEQGSDNSNGNKKSCDRGYYCIEGSAEPIPCPAGSYSNSLNLEKESDCTVCPPNYYCPNIRATTYDSTNHKCAPGFTCPASSVQPRHTICPLGNKCAQTVNPVACDPVAGEYQDQMGATVCLTCPVGYYCD